MPEPKPLKKLIEERRKPVIAHHSTWLGIDPHSLNAESSIHAGTMKAAYERLPQGLDKTVEDSDYESGDVVDSYLHSYEIPRHLINPTMHKDPDVFASKGRLRHSATSRKRMPMAPERLPNSAKQIVQYTNAYEDRGSTSYLIPSHMVAEGRVKHLGLQFVASHEVTEGNSVNDFKAPKTGFDESGNKLKDFA